MERINKEIITGGSKIKTKLGSSVSNGTLRMTAWAFLMLQPFSSADALFCMFLLHSPSVFMDISVFQASTSPSNFSEVVQQIQEFLWRTDSITASTYKTSVSLQKCDKNSKSSLC